MHKSTIAFRLLEQMTNKVPKMKFTTSAQIAAILMLAAVFSSCEPQSKDGTKTDKKYTSWACDIKVVTIDSCEYIVAQASRIDGGLSIVHKQNCKYCAGRK
jgi:hypothetical protein